MSEIITVRDPDIVAAEIRTIQGQARKMALIAAVEIGKRLIEAKEMVPHGEWGKWLQDSVSYSQSTANNMMALYREYGDKDQASLFDDNSQVFEKLSYTQALALLAVPDDERAEFAEKYNVAEMSTRELQQAIKERDEAKASAEEAKANSEKLAKTITETMSKAADLKRAADEAKSSKEQAEQKTVFLQERLDKAKAEAQKAKDQLKEARENPVVSDDVMAQIRKEAEETAAKKAAEKAQKDMEEIKKKLELAEEHARIANKNQAEAEANLELVQQEAKMQEPEIAVFQSMFENLQESLNKVNSYVMKIAATNEHAAEGMKKAMRALHTQELEIMK